MFDLVTKKYLKINFLFTGRRSFCGVLRGHRALADGVGQGPDANERARNVSNHTQRSGS